MCLLWHRLCQFWRQYNSYVTSNHLSEEISVKKLVLHEKHSIFGDQILKFGHHSDVLREKRCADSNIYKNSSKETKHKFESLGALLSAVLKELHVKGREVTCFLLFWLWYYKSRQVFFVQYITPFIYGCGWKVFDKWCTSVIWVWKSTKKCHEGPFQDCKMWPKLRS